MICCFEAVFNHDVSADQEQGKGCSVLPLGITVPTAAGRDVHKLCFVLKTCTQKWALSEIMN